MARPKIITEDLPPLQLRMPREVATAIRVDATKWGMKYGAFIMQAYSFAKGHGLDKWLAEKKRNLPKETREAFQINIPADVALAIKLDAVKNEFKNGEFVQVAYTYAKKNGLYDFLKKQSG